MGKYASDAHVPGTCVKYCTNASPLGEDGTYVWRPNITGGLGLNSVPGASGNRIGFASAGNGAISVSSSSQAHALEYYNATTTLERYGGITFSAENSNNVYTVLGKVYPASIALNFIIKT